MVAPLIVFRQKRFAVIVGYYNFAFKCELLGVGYLQIANAVFIRFKLGIVLGVKTAEL